jgi:membrane-associated phospholipid phosphatase
VLSRNPRQRTRAFLGQSRQRWPALPPQLRALHAAALCVVGLGLTWAVAALVPASQARDAAALDGFTNLTRLGAPAYRVAELADPKSCLLLGVLLIAVALIGSRPRVAAAVPLILLGSALTTELLKPFVAHTHAATTLGARAIPAASWPSGHATAAMALALCAVIVAPKRLRPIAACLGAVFATAVGFSLLILARHMPSDVVGGYLVAALWVSIALAAVRRADDRWPVRTGRRTLGRASEALRVAGAAHRRDARVPGAIAAIVLTPAAVLSSPRAPEALAYAGAHPSLLAAAAAITALAVALAASLAVAVRGS